MDWHLRTRFSPTQPRDTHGRWRLVHSGIEALYVGANPKHLSDTQLLVALNEAERFPERAHTPETKRHYKRLRHEAKRRGLTPESDELSHIPGMPRSPLSRTPYVEPKSNPMA